MPDWRALVDERLGGLEIAPERALEIAEEMSQHLQDHYEDLRRSMGEADALRVALAEIDDVDEPGGDAQGELVRTLADVERRLTPEPMALGRERSNMFGNVLQDLSYAFRSMRRQRGFSTVVIATLALTIGATTAIFSVVDGVMLRPLPYPDIERILVLSEMKRSGDRMSISWPNYQDWRAHADSFEALGVFRSETANLTGSERPERLDASLASSEVFRAMGIGPELGRTFAADDDRAGAERVVLISDRLWHRRFGGDPGIVGRTLSLDGNPSRVVGVMPPQMRFPSRRTDLWMALGPLVDSFPAERGNHPGLQGIAKLKPGVRFEQAAASMDTIARQLEKQYPDTNHENAVWMLPYYEQVVSDVRPALLLLLGSVGLVLLIGCANLANLLLARAGGRRREIAVRTALGASRRRVIQQMLTESLLQALIGGALGAALAAASVRAFVASRPTSVPRIDLLSVDLRVLGFVALLSIATGLLFGMAPALRASAPDVATPLREAASGAVGGRRRLRGGLVVAEVSLALMLLIGAGLLVRSFARLLAVDKGFEPDRVLTMRMTLPASKYQEPAAWQGFHAELVRRVQALPEVEVAALNSVVPLEGGGSESAVLAEGQPLGPHGPETETLYQTGTPGYLRAMGIQLLDGRDFTEHDTAKSVPVALVDETLVRKLFPTVNPIGKRIAFEFTGESRETFRPQYREIVGVVHHVRHYGLVSEPPYVQIYTPLQQLPLWMHDRRPSMVLVVRTAAPERVTEAIRREVAAIDPDIPLYGIQSMTEYVRQETEQPRLSVVLLGSFALLACGLAVLGVYGVLSFLVSERRREIGVRMALGATRRDVLRLVLGRGMALTGLGILIGLVGAIGMSHAMQSMLYGISARDPLTFAAVAAGLGLAAFVACYVPGRRATGVDPATALHHD